MSWRSFASLGFPRALSLKVWFGKVGRRVEVRVNVSDFLNPPSEQSSSALGIGTVASSATAYGPGGSPDGGAHSLRVYLWARRAGADVAHGAERVSMRGLKST